jgi:hypothetical protein
MQVLQSVSTVIQKSGQGADGDSKMFVKICQPTTCLVNAILLSLPA